jgi:hypothetical protein
MWVLIIIYITRGNAANVHSVEFSSKEACEKSWEELAIAYNEDEQSTDIRTYKHICVQK